MRKSERQLHSPSWKTLLDAVAEVAGTSFTHGTSQDSTTRPSLGTRWFQEKAWTPTSKLEGSHQQGSQEDRDRMGRGTGGNGGQEKLVDSCRPMHL